MTLHKHYVEIFQHYLVLWPFIGIHGKFYGDHHRGTPPSGG